jgi:hypothetical protein
VTRATWLLLAGCVLVCVAVEGAARLGFSRASKIQHRFTTEYAAAQQVGVGPHQGRSVLFIGNSLLLEGVKFDTLRAALARDYDAHRLVSERTSYYDWYFGLKRLFAEGARPDIVVLTLASPQWITDEIRGDYAARYLMRASDWREARRDLHWNGTKTTNFLVANASEFWGARSELRIFALQFLVPNIEPLTDLFTSNPGAPPLRADDVEPVTAPRLARLQALVEAYHATLVLNLPPTVTIGPQGDGWLGVVRAAAAAGVTVVRPLPPDTFTIDEFRDAGYHLNDKGAERYTALLLPDLRVALREASPTAVAGSPRPSAAQ